MPNHNPSESSDTQPLLINASSSPQSRRFYGAANSPSSRRQPHPLKHFQSFASVDSGENISFTELIKGLPGKLIRRGSVIVPETGERRRGGLRGTADNVYTSLNDDMDELERQPLIPTMESRPSIVQRVSSQISAFNEWVHKNKYHNVIKCSIAYLLASLAVYYYPLSLLLGKSDSKHVVATVAVYFHPSRTFGSMHQALIFVFFSLVFSFSVSLLSTAIASTVCRHGYPNISAFINLMFASVSLGFVSFMKQKMNHPTFNVACSLASITLVSAIVKEGALDSDSIPINRLYSLFKIVLFGCSISVLICYTIMPSSAQKKLKRSLNESCSLMSQYLSLIETSFIHNRNITSDEAITQINKQMKKNSSTVKNDLEEAKYELLLTGREQEYRALAELVQSVQLMKSQLGGLKGSADMQWEALHEDHRHHGSSRSDSASVHTLDSGESERIFGSRPTLPQSDSIATLDEMSALNSRQLFDLFIYYLGPSLKSFSYTIRGVLDGMPFEETDEGAAKETYHYRNSLKLAGELFKSKYERAITKLYSQNIFSMQTPLEMKIDEEEVAASCGNFASILSEYTKELDHFVLLLTNYSEIVEENPRSWKWLEFWRRFNEPMKPMPGLDYALENLNSELQKRTDTTDQRETFNYRIWEFFSFFRRVEVQFGIRVGLGAFVLASLAFLPQTRLVFMEWRGEWALVTYSIIMNKSLGGTTMTVNWRLVGTFIGAFTAYLVWTLSDGNPYALCITGWLISLYSFHIILNWTDVNAFGRFILLTYNITALYSYNTTRSEDLEEGDDTDPIIADIAIHRFLGITAGVLWALFMTISFLPLTARNRLKRGLSVLWLRLGVVWNSDPLEYRGTELVGLADQRGVVHIMNELGLALKQAPKETRLKGKFRIDIYRKLLECTERITDAFQNMNTMLMIDTSLSDNELAVLQYTETERDELQNRVFLIFYMISSSIILGIPLPSKPASTEHSRDRIMMKLVEIRQKGELANEDYVLLYSYILNTNVIVKELNKIIVHLGDLFGIVHEETFEM
ncbi:Protein BRE4 [Cyberlindnera fabianii]|uniref:Protein BRE4 n=1 Tax=Cyberlindnera fabianii TaxID=36022 RepID=A0A1V2L4G6_CYBFA|nr:Protein BRE4 [Cyberlindnera fabianii]